MPGQGQVPSADRPPADRAPAGRPPAADRPADRAPAGRPAAADRARFTSRAAVLAVVLCAIALSLAYPVREYIAQRKQLDQLQAQRQALVAQLRQLERHQRQLNDPAYVEQLARDRLHLCLRGNTCYVVIIPSKRHTGGHTDAASLTPWYERVWQSVQQANRGGSPAAAKRGSPR